MHSMLTPVLALVALTLVVWVWMYATRIPAMQKAGITPQAARRPGTWEAGIPSSARQVAENYNHLLEQPTIFYALAFYIVLVAHTDRTHVYLAWALCRAARCPHADPVHRQRRDVAVLGVRTLNGRADDHGGPRNRSTVVGSSCP
jgi:hypothetical protein